jgi:hypothetical protein
MPRLELGGMGSTILLRQSSPWVAHIRQHGSGGCIAGSGLSPEGRGRKVVPRGHGMNKLLE